MSKSSLFWPVVWAVSSSLFLSACSRPDIDTTAVVRPVRVVQLQAQGSLSEDHFSGQVEPRIQANLSFQVNGKLLARQVNVGDRVTKGQVLARLDPQDLNLAVQAAQAQFDAAQLEHAQLKTELERANTLKQQNFISQAELDRRQLALDAAASRLTQAKAQLGNQSNQKQYGDLRAPGDGVISKVYSEVGQVVPAGQPVVQWANQNEVQVAMAVPESRVAELRVGQLAQVVLWSDQKSLQAKVREVSPLADPMTRTFAVFLDLNDPERLSRFGMSATVTLARDGQEGVFKLPIAALVAQPTGAFVWVFDEAQGMVSKRMIQPVDVSESSFLVKQGLNNGEWVVIAGTHVLNEGQKVRRFVEPGEVVK